MADKKALFKLYISLMCTQIFDFVLFGILLSILRIVYTCVEANLQYGIQNTEGQSRGEAEGLSRGVLYPILQIGFYTRIIFSELMIYSGNRVNMFKRHSSTSCIHFLNIHTYVFKNPLFIFNHIQLLRTSPKHFYFQANSEVHGSNKYI